jgi:hypothetical protein
MTGNMFANTAGFSVNLQFGTDPITQNTGLVNMASFYHPSAAQIIKLTTTWIQTSVANVYFSASGIATYQFIGANYVRIA